MYVSPLKVHLHPAGLWQCNAALSTLINTVEDKLKDIRVLATLDSTSHLVFAICATSSPADRGARVAHLMTFNTADNNESRLFPPPATAGVYPQCDACGLQGEGKLRQGDRQPRKGSHGHLI